jgi:stalled ribosome alternative rescue factor ArfA
MKTILLEDAEIQVVGAMLDQRINILFQLRIEESKKGKNKDERYAKQLLEEYNCLENLIKKLKS